MGGIGTVICGRVESGSIEEGAWVFLAPSGAKAQVKSIESFDKTVGDRAKIEGGGMKMVVTNNV